MAARENQGYLIAVIILVLLTLVLALAAFLGLSKASENSDANLQLENQVKYQKKLVEAYKQQAEVLMAFSGGTEFGPAVGEAAQMQTALDNMTRGFEGNEQKTLQDIADKTKTFGEAFKKDMAGVTTEEGANVTWRQRIRDLTQLVAKKNDEYNVQVESSERTDLDAQAKIADITKTMQTQQSEMAKLKEEAAAAAKANLEKEAELKDSLDKAVAENRKVNEDAQKARQAADEQYRIAQNDIKIANDTNQDLKAEINKLTRKDFDRADGRIISVAAGLRNVIVDLGRDHGLAVNQKFSVYDKNVNNFSEGQHKAKIEITKVHQFQSEALITFETPRDPILSGDHILTPVWDPGYSVPMAVAGRFDLDGDIYDDTQKLIQMINRNGGKVVAYHDDEGNIQGKVDSSVRFLVVGDPPVSGANSENPEAARAIVIAMQQMQEDAKANTVEPINMQKLLNRMGVRAQPKTKQFEKRSGGFARRSASDTLKSEDN